MKIRQGAACGQHRREQNLFFTEPQSIASADQNLNMAGRGWMAEFVEDFFGVHFHQIDVLYEEPEMAIKSGGINRIDHRNKRSPVFVKKLEGLFFELAFTKLIHESRFIDSFLPAFVTFRGKLGDKFSGFRFVQFEHPKPPVYTIPPTRYDIVQPHPAVKAEILRRLPNVMHLG